MFTRCNRYFRLLSSGCCDVFTSIAIQGKPFRMTMKSTLWFAGMAPYNLQQKQCLQKNTQKQRSKQTFCKTTIHSQTEHYRSSRTVSRAVTIIIPTNWPETHRLVLCQRPWLKVLVAFFQLFRQGR